MLHKILILAVLSAASLLSAQTTSPEYYNLMGDADKEIKDGNWAAAEEYLRQALRLEPANPSNVLLMSNLGMVQFYDGRELDALSTLNSAHAMAPASVTVLLNRAKVYASIGRSDKAADDYNTVVRLDSTLVEPRFYLAMIALDEGKAAVCSQRVDSLTAIAPDHRLTHVASAMLLMHTCRYSEAIPHWSTALREDADAAYYSSRALCYLLTDQIAAAAEDISSGLALDPTDGELYLYRALLNKMRFRPDDAKADGELAVKWGVNPDRVKALLK